MNNSFQEEIRILKNIERLQGVEKALYRELEYNSNNSANAGDPYLKTIGGYPYEIGSSGYSFEGAGEVCAKEGGRLCKKSEVVDKDICAYGWLEDRDIGFPMAHANAETSWGCGGPTPGWHSGAGLPSAAAHCCKTETQQLSQNNVDSIINQINEVSEVRMSLFKSLNYTYKSLQKNVNTSKSELVELMTVVSIVEDELNNAKIQLNEIYGIKTNKMRMVEINTYYKKRYDAQSKLMKTIIFIGVLLFVLATIYKKSLLPATISKILLSIVIVIGGFSIIWGVLDISWRDNMNFDAYDYKTHPEVEVDYGLKVPEVLPIDCIGNACCTGGMIYDDNIRKCIKPPMA